MLLQRPTRQLEMVLFIQTKCVNSRYTLLMVSGRKGSCVCNVYIFIQDIRLEKYNKEYIVVYNKYSAHSKNEH